MEYAQHDLHVKLLLTAICSMTRGCIPRLTARVKKLSMVQDLTDGLWSNNDHVSTTMYKA